MTKTYEQLSRRIITWRCRQDPNMLVRSFLGCRVSGICKLVKLTFKNSIWMTEVESQNLFSFHPYVRKLIQFYYIIFFKRVENTNTSPTSYPHFISPSWRVAKAIKGLNGAGEADLTERLKAMEGWATKKPIVWWCFRIWKVHSCHQKNGPTKRSGLLNLKIAID